MLVQDTWRPIQERFFEEAERAAKREAHERIAAGEKLRLQAEARMKEKAAKRASEQALIRQQNAE